MPINYMEIVDAENAGKPPVAPNCDSTINPEPPADPPAPDVEAGAEGYLKNKNSCVIFIKKDPNTGKQEFVNKEATDKICAGICGESVKQRVEAGDTSSVSCIAFRPTGNTDPMKEPVQQGDTTLSPGDCTCNDPIMDLVAETYVDAIAATGEVAEEAWKSAIEMAITIGPMLIPGVGQAIGGPLMAGITTAKLAQWTYVSPMAPKLSHRSRRRRQA